MAIVLATALALVSVAGLGAPRSPLAAAEPARAELDALADALRGLVPEAERTTLAEATVADGADDLFHPSGEPPGITPPETDIALVASFDVEMTAAVADAEVRAGGILDCDRDGTICAKNRAREPAGTRFHVYAGTTREAPAPGADKRLEFGVVAYDETPRDGRPAEAWAAIPEFPGDFFDGSNLAWRFLSEAGEPVQLARLEYGPGDAGFLAAPTDAVAIVRGSAWAIVIPAAEWEGVVGARAFTFRADGGNFAPETSAVDTYPDVGQPLARVAGAPVIKVETVESPGVDLRWILITIVALVVIGGLIAVAVAVRRRAR